MAFAERQFRLARRTPDGATSRDHLESAARQLAAMGKKPPKALEPVVDAEACPEGAEYIWGWFCEIVVGLDANGFSAPTISWASLRAWRKERHIGRLEPWEALALVQLGALRASVLSETTKPTSTPGGRSNG